MRTFILLVNILFLAKLISAQSQLIELGTVNWLRSYDAAIERSELENKPILILFQEVPGCSTCQNYGNDVLSHPLIVEAIENSFIALAIFNNKKGEDARILRMYNEPSWNNPVVRIVDSSGKDLIQRVSGSYTPASLVLNMVLALTISNHEVPIYLQLLKQELLVDRKDQKTDYFSMYCFWSGEAFFGDKDGVVRTEPGFMNGKEVVRVYYDASTVKLNDLIKDAKKEGIKHESKRSKFRNDKDPQYYLKKSNYRFLALSQIQKTKINAAIKNSEDPRIYLSPAQKKCLFMIEKYPSRTKNRSLYEKDLREAWDLMLEIIE